ncbi:heme-binding protein [Gordonia sp. zg691]|uniref:Heme-binding protein n=1 Tax=Gordonia jinghuaiqii TaxID=2758710 RepID=A0A7D7RA83_9ACTN|nr:heme-binding protein [Gordonia jinghuaiqii]MBD0860417.1 heme-binding protein [Gordonia jinghuaiqii]MCR5978313.1 heme-binding protein [Gordonia jinghuaiqii]QMT01250.1 heme-binding protein [Gordonia jinghuaiqii]
MLQISRIDLAEAKALIASATERSLEIDVPMCIAVVDESGYLVAFDRMDTAKITSVSLAVDKAFTAAGARNHTSFYGTVSQPGGPAWGINQTNDGHFNVIPGGVPIIVDGSVIGGIGISGGNSAQDDDVAAHAINRAGVGQPVEVPATAGTH